MPASQLSFVTLVLAAGLSVTACNSTPPPDVRVQYLETYIEAWTTADAEAAHDVLDAAFVLHDPDYGDITKTEFIQYFSVLKDKVGQLGGAQPGQPYLAASDVAYRAQDEVLVAWVHWQFPPTFIEGASLFRIGPEGLLSEQLFNKTPFAGQATEEAAAPQ